MTDTKGEDMNDQTYNGWKNYPTWAVNLWLCNDESLYHETLERTSEAIRDSVSERNKIKARGGRSYLSQRESYRYHVSENLKEWVTDELVPDLGATFAADLLGYALGCVDWGEIADSWIQTIEEARTYA